MGEISSNFFERTPPPLANARQPTKKFSSHFLICARPIFSSKREKKLFCRLLLLTEQAAGAASFFIRYGMAESPPPSPLPPPKIFFPGFQFQRGLGGFSFPRFQDFYFLKKKRGRGKKKKL